MSATALQPSTTQTLSTKVGDVVDATIIECRMEDGALVESPVVYTFRVESVDDFGKTIGCRGTILGTTSTGKHARPVGAQFVSYVAKVAA